jgi:hypothetical protein
MQSMQSILSALRRLALQNRGKMSVMKYLTFPGYKNLSTALQKMSTVNVGKGLKSFVK